MAIEERVELEGGRDVERALSAIAAALGDVTQQQDRQTRSTKTLTAEEKRAKAATRKRRAEIRAQRRALRDLERQRRRNIRTLKSFVGGMTGAQFGAAALGAAIVGLAAGSAKLALDFGEIVNELTKVGRAFDLSADQIAAMEFTLGRLTRGGVDVSKALTAVADAAGKAAQGSVTYERVFDQLGIQVETAGGRLRNTTDIMNDLRSAISGMENPTERMSVATELFGRRMAANLLPALQATTGEVAALEDRYYNLAGAIGDASDEAEAQQDALLDMKTAARGLRLEIGELLSPAITAGANALASALSTLRRALSEGSGGGNSAEELLAELQTVEAVNAELEEVEAKLRRMRATQAVGFDSEAAEADRVAAERLKERVRGLQGALGLLQQRNELETAGAAIVDDAANDAAGATRTLIDLKTQLLGIGEKITLSEADSLKLLKEQTIAVRERMAAVDGELAQNAVDMEIQRQQALDETIAKYQEMIDAQQRANEDAINGIASLLDASAGLAGMFENDTAKAIAKALKIGSTIVKTIQAVQAASSVASAIARTESAVATTQKTAELATIATAGATAATLSSIAQGPSSIGTILGVVGAIIGGVASVVGIALAERGATPDFLSSLPAIDSAGHRMVGVMPNEKILDPGATRSQERLLTAAANYFSTGGAANGPAPAARSGTNNIAVNIGGHNIAQLAVDTDRRRDRFSVYEGVA